MQFHDTRFGVFIISGKRIFKFDEDDNCLKEVEFCDLSGIGIKGGLTVDPK